jgi:hypothetical protein
VAPKSAAYRAVDRLAARLWDSQRLIRPSTCLHDAGIATVS